MLLSMIPFYGSALNNEFENMETLEEIPFEFELKPGDLPFEQLKDAVLEAEDIPFFIDPALADARDHVNRLYLQEPDDCTVMFQNRDGSKTIYLFSHPVKGMTMSTTAMVQVNGTNISFTGSNAITSCIAELSDFNIGYAEVAYLPNGVLSVDGINLTEDARGWARCESTASALVYNISSETAAEYAASVTSPNTDVATVAVVPGVTITPIDPEPFGGMTVMSISYSDLAGLMSFKNVTTNQFLTLTTSSNPSLTTNPSIVYKYSQWVVQYDSYFGYVVSNLSNVYNTYLGFDDMDNYIIDSLSYMMDTFTISIESTDNSIVTIDCGQMAINANGSLYEKSEDDDYFPTSCEWRILAKTTLRLATGISLPQNRTTRIEQSGVSFPFEYTFSNPYPTHYDLDLYNASNNQPFAVDSEVYEDDEYWCSINTPGIYAVYYKDVISGVKSANFVLIIVDSLVIYSPKDTYSITPASMSTGADCLFLTVHTTNGLLLGTKTFKSEDINRGDNLPHSVLCEELANVSRTFTFKYANSSQNMVEGVYITATMSTSQYGATPNSTSIDNGNKYTGSYSVLDSDTMPNTLVYTDSVDLIAKEEGGTLFKICNMGSYYLIIYDTYIINNSVVVNALKMNAESNSVEIGVCDGSDSFKWRIEQVGVDAPAIKQVYKYWCGPTSFLQVLYGMGVDATVDGNNLSEQQTTISNAWGIGLSPVLTKYYKDNMNGFKLVDKILEPTNRWLPDNYTCNEIVNPTEQELRTNIRNSLDSGAACIIFTVSGGKPYKYSYKVDDDGIPYAHYICVIGYDEVSDTVILSNCHYSRYRFGIHEVDFSDFCEDVGRLLYFEKLSN